MEKKTSETLKRGFKHNFETQPGHRLGPVIGSRVRRVGPGQQKKKHLYKTPN
jgi:hypothetical protein